MTIDPVPMVSLQVRMVQDAPTLRESEAQLRLALQSGSLGSWLLDAVHGTFLEVSETCLANFGLSPGSDFSYAALLAAIHPDDLHPVRRSIADAFATGQDYAAEYRVIWPDGTLHWISAHGHPVLDADGQPARMIGVTQDITDRKRTEQDLRLAIARQRTFLKDVLASVTDGRLTLCDEEADLPSPLTPLDEPILLSMQGGLRELRAQAQDAATRAGLSDERGFDLAIAVGEAGMNTIVHVGEGTGQVFFGKDRAQVKVVDHGSGIALEHLPKATLARGFSTKATLGHGMKMMLQTVDRTFLITGETGTTVVVEQDRVPPLPDW